MDSLVIVLNKMCIVLSIVIHNSGIVLSVYVIAFSMMIKCAIVIA